MISRSFSKQCIRSIFKLNNMKINNSPFLSPVTPEASLNTICRRNFTKISRISNHENIVNFFSRNIYTKLPRTPELIYIPHITRWLKTKFRFKLLQKTWDPEFTEGSFIYGTSIAICRITEIIHENKPEQLKGLLTTSALIKLKDDMATKLTKTQKLIIRIRPEDIKILVPMSVTLNKDKEHKNCRISMRVLALKWVMHNNSALRLVLVALQTEFLRDYTPGAFPDWIISAFEILECTVLAKSP